MRRKLSVMLVLAMLISLIPVFPVAQAKPDTGSNVPQEIRDNFRPGRVTKMLDTPRTVEDIPDYKVQIENVNRTKAELGIETKSVTVPDLTLTGASANSVDFMFVRFNDLNNLSDATPIIGTIQYMASCQANRKVYAIDRASNLYEHSYSTTTGGMGPANFVGAMQVNLVPTEMTYDPVGNKLLIVYGMFTVAELDLRTALLQEKCVVEDGVAAIGMSKESRTVYCITHDSTFGILSLGSGSVNARFNMGKQIVDSSQEAFIQSGTCHDGYFFWNYIHPQGESRLIIIDITKREFRDLGLIYDSPGVQLHGMFLADPIEDTPNDGPEEFSLFYENWESVYTWGIADFNQDGSTWENINTNYPAMFDDGSRIMVNRTINANGELITPDDWLITLPINLPADEENIYLNFYACGALVENAYEKVDIYIAPAGQMNLTEFERIAEVEVTGLGGRFYEIDLSEYRGRELAIAFRHVESSIESGVLMIDAVGVGTIHPFHTVTFVDSLTDEVIEEQQVRHNVRARNPRPPKHDYYEFTGWSYKYAIVDDMTIYAEYEAEEFDVVYYVDNSYYYTDSCGYGEVIELIDEPTRPGYIFSGWSEVPETMPAETVNVYGTFTAQNYTVTFKDGLTGETISETTVGHGMNVTFPEPPVHEGYAFTGWDSDGKNITQDTVITAQYREGGYEIGDANCDGKINTGDAVFVLRYIAFSEQISSEQLDMCDVNADGKINTGDAVQILRKIAGL